MEYINKQKFLTELGRLLTFMYEEDRQLALNMYTRMFDETEDEQGLLRLLVSPTRQAVVLARSYDAKERKLQVSAQAREEYAAPDSDGVLPFVLAIDKIAKEAEGLSTPKIPVTEGQFSLFEEIENELDAGTATEDTTAEAETAAGEDGSPEESEASAAAASETESVPEAPAEDIAECEEAFKAEESPEEALEDNHEEASVEAVDAAEEFPAREEKPEDSVDAFLEDFTISEDPVEKNSESEAPAFESVSDISPAVQSVERSVPELSAEPDTVKKTSVGLLILFIIFAIPITLIGIIILLIPTLLCLSLAIAAVYLGIMSLNIAFTAFSVFADKLVLIGLGIALAALGLLFVWTFIWFLGGAVAGLVRGVVSLGRKICCKEVAKE